MRISSIFRRLWRIHQISLKESHLFNPFPPFNVEDKKGEFSKVGNFGRCLKLKKNRLCVSSIIHSIDRWLHSFQHWMGGRGKWKWSKFPQGNDDFVLFVSHVLVDLLSDDEKFADIVSCACLFILYFSLCTKFPGFCFLFVLYGALMCRESWATSYFLMISRWAVSNIHEIVDFPSGKRRNRLVHRTIRLAMIKRWFFSMIFLLTCYACQKYLYCPSHYFWTGVKGFILSIAWFFFEIFEIFREKRS